jgi:hypothetical protein
LQKKYSKPRLIARLFKNATHCKNLQNRDSLQNKKKPRLHCKTRLLCKKIEKKENATQLQIGLVWLLGLLLHAGEQTIQNRSVPL